MCHFSRFGIWPKGHLSAAVLISTLESGSDIWPKGHLRLLSLDLKFKEQGRDVSACDIPSIGISKW
jgi:hypothetical protein